MLVVGDAGVDYGVVDVDAVSGCEDPLGADHAGATIALQMYGPKLRLPRPSAAWRLGTTDNV